MSGRKPSPGAAAPEDGTSELMDEAPLGGASVARQTRGGQGKAKRNKRKQDASSNPPAEDGAKQAKAEVEVTEPDSSGRIPRAETPRATAPEASQGRSFKALSWNVNGLRALLKQKPEKLVALIKDEDPDYVCLQEHKLQQGDIEAVQKEVEGMLPGYQTYWSAATVKKGYSGTAVIVKTPKGSKVKAAASAQKSISAFFKPKQPDTKPSANGDATAEGLDVLSISYDMPGRSNPHSGEGRVITVEYDGFFLVGAYVPNSGMKLERLDYRVQEWDEDLRSYLQELCLRKPAILTGDLNVAHLDIDIYNAAAKHIAKGAGTTPRERSSFGNLLAAGFVDSFRHQHPSAKGCYSYWSVRTGARSVNKGLRLDYFVVPESICGEASRQGPRLHDAWILDTCTLGASDHCPVGIILAGV